MVDPILVTLVGCLCIALLASIVIVLLGTSSKTTDKTTKTNTASKTPNKSTTSGTGIPEDAQEDSPNDFDKALFEPEAGKRLTCWTRSAASIAKEPGPARACRMVPISPAYLAQLEREKLKANAPSVQNGSKAPAMPKAPTIAVPKAPISRAPTATAISGPTTQTPAQPPASTKTGQNTMPASNNITQTQTVSPAKTSLVQQQVPSIPPSTQIPVAQIPITVRTAVTKLPVDNGNTTQNGIGLASMIGLLNKGTTEIATFGMNPLDIQRIYISYNGPLMVPFKTMGYPKPENPYTILTSKVFSTGNTATGNRVFPLSVVPADSMLKSVPAAISASFKAPLEFVIRAILGSQTIKKSVCVPHSLHGNFSTLILIVTTSTSAFNLDEMATVFQKKINDISNGHVAANTVYCAVIRVNEGYIDKKNEIEQLGADVANKLNWNLGNVKTIITFYNRSSMSHAGLFASLKQYMGHAVMGIAGNGTIMHEVLHTFGLSHSDSTHDDIRLVTEYGDSFCVMGSAGKTDESRIVLNAPQQYLLGWLDEVVYFDMHKLSRSSFSESLTLKYSENFAIVMHVPVIVCHQDVHTDWVPYPLFFISMRSRRIFIHEFQKETGPRIPTIKVTTPSPTVPETYEYDRDYTKASLVPYIVDANGLEVPSDKANSIMNAMGTRLTMPRNIPTKFKITVKNDYKEKVSCTITIST